MMVSEKAHLSTKLNIDIGSKLQIHPFRKSQTGEYFIWKSRKGIRRSTCFCWLAICTQFIILFGLIATIGITINHISVIEKLLISCLILIMIDYLFIQIYHGSLRRLNALTDLSNWFRKLERKYDRLLKTPNNSIPSQKINRIINWITLVALLGEATILPFFLYLMLIPSSPIKSTVKIWDCLILEPYIAQITDQEPLFSILLIYSKVSFCFILTISLAPGTFYSLFIIQLCLLYVESVTQRFHELLTRKRRLLFHGSYFQPLIPGIYRQYQLYSKYMNEETCYLFHFFYLWSILLITFLITILIKVHELGAGYTHVLSMVTVVFVLGTMLGTYIEHSVNMTRETKTFVQFMRTQSLYCYWPRGSNWKKRFWKSCSPLKNWVGHWFSLESKDLVLIIFGLIVESILNFWLTLKARHISQI